MKRLWRRVSRSLCARSLKRNCSTWYLCDLVAPAPTDLDTTAGAAFSVLEGEARKAFYQWLIDHRASYPWIYFPEEIRSSQANNHWFPILKEGDELIAWVKLGRGSVFIHDFEGSLTLPAEVAFIYDTFVKPEHRGLGLGDAILQRTKAALAERGYRAVACHIEDWNTASINLFGRNGFRPMGQVCYRRVLLLRYLSIEGSLSTVTGLPAWLEEKLVQRSAPAARPARPPA